MKTTNFLYTIIIAFYLSAVSGCLRETNHRTGPATVLILEMDTLAANKADSSRSSNFNTLARRVMQVITFRLKGMGIDTGFIEISRSNKIKDSNKNNLITLKIWRLQEFNVSTQDLNRVLQTSAKLSFWETYENADIYPLFTEANKRLAAIPGIANDSSNTKDYSHMNKLSAQLRERDDSSQLSNSKKNPLFRYLTPSTEQTSEGSYALRKGPVVGTAKIADTERINKYLQMPDVISVFPPDLKFYWTANPYYRDRLHLELVAIKGPAPALSGDILIQANRDFDKESGHPSIDIQMTPEAAVKWQGLTRENVGRSIAIMLDGRVYSFPVVQSEISKGRSIISGNFSMIEAEELVNELNSGSMPVPVKIVKEKVEQ